MLQVELKFLCRSLANPCISLRLLPLVFPCGHAPSEHDVDVEVFIVRFIA